MLHKIAIITFRKLTLRLLLCHSCTELNSLALYKTAGEKLKVTIEETVDTELLGGAIIKAGDLVIDGSAKGRIEKLTTALMR